MDVGATHRDLRPDARLGRYHLLGRLGSGGAGQAFVARDALHRRRVVLRRLDARVGPPAQVLAAARALLDLRHPNVAAVLHASLADDAVVVAAELVDGVPLPAWLRGARAPGAVLRVFLDAGRGLVAAHRAGLVHRDFRPASVIVGRDGRARVVDFGLAQPRPGDPAADLRRGRRPARSASPVGTPAYMAPEQLAGGPADERSDQFSFCVALWEALAGAPPFPGEHAAELHAAILRGRPAGAARIPPRLLVPLRRGLAAAPPRRFASMAALLAALAPRPAARRRWLAAAVALLVVAGWLGLRGDAERDALARAALAARDAAAELRAAADAARDEALAHFAAGRRDAGEAAWARHLAAARRCDEQLRVAGDGLARLLAGEPDDALRAARVDVLLARAALAEATHRAGDLQAHRAALAAELGPDELRARWDLPAQLTVTSDPPGAEVLLAGSLRGPLADPLADPHRVSAAERLGVTPLPAQARPAGYYVLRLRRAGHPDVAQPLLLGRGEALTLAFALPAAVPDGFVHVPAGRFLYGAGTGSADEPRRHGLYAEPLQPRSTGAFLVGRDEVTWGEYLAYLDDLAPDDRGAALPGAAQPLAVGLAAGPRGWTLTLGDERRAAGEPLRARGGLAEDIDWRRLPVLGVTVAQARGYAGWLARRVPGARLCTDLEWEKAARGVDGRVAPDMWAPPGAASERGPGGGPTGGPVPVGTRPATSPFGLRDVQGNAAEIVVAGGEYLLRGGSYHAARPALRLDAREPLAPDARDARAGFRVCASP